MPTSREMLESTFRTGRMKRLVARVYLAQAIMTVILMIMVVVLFPEASFYPMYIPVYLILYVIAIMLILVNLEGFFFKYIAIKHGKSDSDRFLMTKNYTKTGIFVIIAAIIILLIALILFPAIGQNIDTEEEMKINGSGATSSFSSQDIFAFSGVERITLTSKELRTLDVYILTRDDSVKMDLESRINRDDDKSLGVTNFSYEVEGFIDKDEYVIYVEVVGGGPANITYTLDRSISNNVSQCLIAFPILFCVANACWIIYLQPLKKRYRKTSIYE